MNLYMALAPPWAQVLPQPPPAAKFTIPKIRPARRRIVEVNGPAGGNGIEHNITKYPARASGQGSKERRNTMTTVTREGVIIRQETLTPEQIEDALVIVFRSYLQAHPEELNMGGPAEAEAAHPQP